MPPFGFLLDRVPFFKPQSHLTMLNKTTCDCKYEAETNEIKIILHYLLIFKNYTRLTTLTAMTETTALRARVLHFQCFYYEYNIYSIVYALYKAYTTSINLASGIDATKLAHSQNEAISLC